MYANNMQIVLPNDMSCCRRWRAEGREGTNLSKMQGSSRVKNKWSDIQIVNYIIAFFFH